VLQPIRGQYTLSHGITPGVATIEMLPQAGFGAEIGDLVFTYADVELVFPDCKVDRATLRYDANGFVWQVSVLDRRWAWAFGTISGSYNTRQDDGRIFPDRQQEPSFLADLCLDAMGEDGYDTSAMPTGVYPEIEWNVENPAQALADLAEQCGCRVVLQLDDTVAVVPTGVGAVLPENDLVIADSLTINPPERPDQLAYYCGPTRYQMDIPLVAVGLDTDGTIKKIDDLSYAPNYGWEFSDYVNFSDIAQDSIPSEKNLIRALARQTVFRWYQIALEIEDDNGNPYVLEVPDFGQVTKLKEVFLLNKQVALMEDWDRTERAAPAQVVGQWFDFNVKPENTEPNSIYWRGFNIDPVRGLVMFNDPVIFYEPQFELDDEGNWIGAAEPPDISLRTAFQVRDFVTWEWDRYVRTLDFGTKSIGSVVPTSVAVKVYLHEESFLAIRNITDGNGNQTLDTNRDDLNVECDAYLKQAQLEFQTPLPQDLAYAGLWPISPDGAIQQVGWSVGPEGATTRASRNSEFSTAVPLYQTRRLFEQIRNKRVLLMKQKVLDLWRNFTNRLYPPDF
jgi:hypothetical protein